MAAGQAGVGKGRRMSFQAYLDNIYAKTGTTADEFKAVAAKKGLTRHADILAWL